MQTIAHIINPVKVSAASDLYVAQPVTVETMRTACESSPPGLDVSLFTAQYPEDRCMVPAGFTATPDLERSVAGIQSFTIARKLPLIKDILDRLYAQSTAEFLVYTNVDIALQPYFYQTVSALIQQGYDAFAINRRTIPGTYQHTAEIPRMYTELGEPHKGWDCFVFKRSLYPRFELGTACIGAGWIGRVMIANMACLARRFKIFTHLHLTFHIGNEKAWKSDKYDDYIAHNRNETRKILTTFEHQYGPFNRTQIPGRFLRLLEKNKNK